MSETQLPSHLVDDDDDDWEIKSEKEWDQKKWQEFRRQFHI